MVTFVKKKDNSNYTKAVFTVNILRPEISNGRSNYRKELSMSKIKNKWEKRQGMGHGH